MKQTLLIILIALFSNVLMNGQIFITELADPQDRYNARYVELFNSGDSEIDLESLGYGLLRYTNANTEHGTIYQLTGTIPANGFYLVAKNNVTFQDSYGFAPDQEISDKSGPADSNGDDQIQLVITDGTETTVVDMFGVAGEDGNGTCHGFFDGRAERSANVAEGNNGNWNTNNWNVWGADASSGCSNYVQTTVKTTDGLFDPGVWIGYSPTNTIVSFESLTSEINEDSEFIDVCVAIENPDASNATKVDFEILNTGTATEGEDYSISGTYSMTFPAGSSQNQCVTFDITDDEDIELTEEIVIQLKNAQGGESASIGNQLTHKLKIIDNDITSPGIGSIIITEIMQNPKVVADDDGEWFEIYNTTDNDIDLFGIKFKDDLGVDEYFVIDHSIILKAKSYFVLARNSDVTINGSVNTDYQYPDNITLSNSTDGVIIECANEVIDAVIYDNGSTYPDPSGASMYLMYDKYGSTANDNGGNWATSTTAFGDGDLGTPGMGDEALSIFATEEIVVSIYPNPVTDGYLTLQFESNGKRTVEIFNALGLKVFEKEVHSAKEQINLNLEIGLFLIKVTDNDKVATHRVIVK